MFNCVSWPPRRIPIETYCERSPNLTTPYPPTNATFINTCFLQYRGSLCHEVVARRTGHFLFRFPFSCFFLVSDFQTKLWENRHSTQSIINIIVIIAKLKNNHNVFPNYNLPNIHDYKQKLFRKPYSMLALDLESVFSLLEICFRA